MQAHLLSFAILVLLAILAIGLRRRGSTRTEVAGDLVTPHALEAGIAETSEAIGLKVAALEARLDEVAAELAKVKGDQAKLGDVGTDTAREVAVIAQALELHFTSDQRRNEQQYPAAVCTTGGHLIPNRVR